MRWSFALILVLSTAVWCAPDGDPLARLKKDHAAGTDPYAYNSAGTGKGSATIRCSGPVTAGSTVDEFAVEYVADAAGIAPGGCVTFGLPSDFSIPQCDDETKSSYMRVSCKNTRFEKRFEPVYISRTSARYATPVHMRMLVVKLPDGLKANARLAVVWSRVQVTQQARGWKPAKVAFRVYVDHDADSWEEEIADSPQIEVLPLDADQLIPLASSTAVVGEPVRCVVSAIDKFGNPAFSYCGTVRFETTDSRASLPAAYKFTADDASSRSFNIVFKTPGFHWITVVDDAGCKAESNPIEVCEKEPAYRLYWGDLHVHTRMSADAANWVPAPLEYDDAYQIGRHRVGMDFMANADHHNAKSGYNQTDWRKMMQITNKANAPGRFVTLVAMEISHGKGDQNVYTAGSSLPFCDLGQRHPLDLWESFKGTDYIAIPHHFAQSMRPWDWTNYDPAISPVAEIYSNHGRAEFLGNTPHYSHHPTPTLEGRTWRDQLNAGRKIGCIASTDNHWGLPGSSGLAAVWAPNLTRTSIFEQIKNRHCYASTNARAILHFTVNGSEMGTEITSRKTPVIRLRGATPTPIAEIVVVKNGVEIPMKFRKGRTFDIEWRDPAFDADAYYYARVQMSGRVPGVQNPNQQFVWSSPVWVTKTK